MTRFFWNLAFAYWLRVDGRTPFPAGYRLAKFLDQDFNEGSTPQEAVENEMQYWEE